MRLVEPNELTDVYIRQAVAVREHERAVRQEALEPCDAPSSHRVEACVDKTHGPVEPTLLHDFDTATLQVHEEVAVVQRVVVEIRFDQFTLIAARHEKVAM